MAEFKEIARNYKRMCNAYIKCSDCPLFEHTGDASTCSGGMLINCEEAERIIMKWVAEHPIMTNGMKFEEVFGKSAEVVWNHEFNAFSEWMDAEYKGGQDETD